MKTYNTTYIISTFILCTLHTFILCEKIPVLISHGFAANGLRPHLYYTAGNEKLLSYLTGKPEDFFLKKQYLFDNKDHDVISFNYPDVAIDLGSNGSIPDPFSAEIAQQKDIETLKKSLDAINSQAIIGFGHSRGSATWLTMLGKTKHEGKIALLILEAPFATMRSTAFFSWLRQGLTLAQNVFNELNIISWCEYLFTCVFGAYRFDGIEPIDVVSDIDLSIPILLVHSKNDVIIPINDSRRLYIALKESGHNVYLFEEEHGDHSALLTIGDCDEYIYLVNALFKKYSLPFKENFSKQLNDLTPYQPTIEEVTKRINTNLQIHSETDSCEIATSSTSWTIEGALAF